MLYSLSRRTSLRWQWQCLPFNTDVSEFTKYLEIDFGNFLPHPHHQFERLAGTSQDFPGLTTASGNYQTSYFISLVPNEPSRHSQGPI